MKRRSGPKSRTSIYLGVTQYKRTGRWEAHIWESSESRNCKGRQLHLGSFPAAEPAALAYDRAAQKLRPWNSHLNFPDTDYSQDDFLRKYGHLDKQEFVQRLRNWAQSPELADECDTSDVPPQVNHRTHSARGDMSPLKQRLPSSKRARKRRHSSNLSNKFPREEPDYQMHIAPSCCHASPDDRQAIPQHILELHALAMGKQPAELLKPNMVINSNAFFTGTQSATYNANANTNSIHSHALGAPNCGPPSSPLPRRRETELSARAVY